MALDVKNLFRLLNETELGADLLHNLGLQRRRGAFASFMAGVGIFTAGALVGAAVGALLAPSSGAELRAKARASIEEWREKLMAWGESMQAQAAEQANAARAKLAHQGPATPEA